MLLHLFNGVLTHFWLLCNELRVECAFWIYTFRVNVLLPKSAMLCIIIQYHELLLMRLGLGVLDFHILELSSLLLFWHVINFLVVVSARHLRLIQLRTVVIRMTVEALVLILLDLIPASICLLLFIVNVFGPWLIVKTPAVYDLSLIQLINIIFYLLLWIGNTSASLVDPWLEVELLVLGSIISFFLMLTLLVNLLAVSYKAVWSRLISRLVCIVNVYVVVHGVSVRNSLFICSHRCSNPWFVNSAFACRLF